MVLAWKMTINTMSFSNLPIKPLEQVKIAWLMLEIDCPAHQHGQKTYIINGFGLENDNQYNEFQSDSSASDNTANAKNTFIIIFAL
jgi:hypothetical protein